MLPFSLFSENEDLTMAAANNNFKNRRYCRYRLDPHTFDYALKSKIQQERGMVLAGIRVTTRAPNQIFLDEYMRSVSL